MKNTLLKLLLNALLTMAVSGMIGACVAYLANELGKGTSLVLTYRYIRNQQGSLRSVRQLLAHDILQNTEEKPYR